MSIFKAYDIRGIYGDELTEELAYNNGRAFVTFVKPKSVVIGHDMRPHSPPLCEALTRGITELGANVIDIGMVSTPMSYFANGKLGAEASIIVTASHNPGQWNGFKLCREAGIPISGATGIMDIERIVLDGTFAPPAATPGTVSHVDIKPQYIEHIRSFANITTPLNVAIDYANGMGIVEGIVLEGLFTSESLFDDLDGTFPNHEANPLVEETYEALQEKMKTGAFDFGIAFDGDADRVGFTDETGAVISMDMITTLIAQAILQKEKGNIFYDLRSSWAAKEVIEENGGTPMMSRVGHAFIKAQMREADALFAGELSGHYYFRENYFTESSALAVIYIANIVSQSGKKLSELVAPLKRYSPSGEINSTVADPDAVFATLKANYADGRQFELDGFSVEYADWWFNVRSSNTEPLIRLNIEAKTPEVMVEKRDELLAIIRG